MKADLIYHLKVAGAIVLIAAAIGLAIGILATLAFLPINLLCQVGFFTVGCGV